MAERLEIGTVTCPAGVTQLAAVETDLSFPAGDVSRIDVHIPAGHAYLTGIAIGQAHGIAIPAGDGDWIIGDDDVLSIDVSGYLNNGSWSVWTFNLDTVYSHSWQLRFHIFELPDRPPAPAMIPPEQFLAASEMAPRRGGRLFAGR